MRTQLFADLSTLRRRRSAKWRTYADDVLPAFIAESDVDLAPPIRAALHAAIALGDTGYAEPDRLYESFASFATRRFGWPVEPGRLRLIPDVMSGIVEALRVLVEPGAGVGTHGQGV